MDSNLRRVLVTGANRGFGLEFVRQYARRGDRVFAACRNPTGAGNLQSLAADSDGRVSVLALEVSDADSIQACHEQVLGQTDALDVLINNAGIGHSNLGESTSETLGSLTFDGLLDIFRVNAAAPLLITQQFLPLLKHGTQPRIVNISSWLGSIGERTTDFDSSYGYAGSKAALNMFSHILSFGLAKDGIIAVPLDPGWARTDMGGEDAEQAVDETVTAMLKRIDALTMAESGHFILWNSGETAW
jgi:NAD(P)-dependent dehydrogenase (short-subunit alcohol dehydrogenase family)